MLARRWRHALIADDDPQPGEPSESNDPVVVAEDATLPVLASPAVLIHGFRYLQQRIPGFIQLSAEEKRALIRVASLDPDFIEAGIRAAALGVRRRGSSFGALLKGCPRRTVSPGTDSATRSSVST